MSNEAIMCGIGLTLLSESCPRCCSSIAHDDETTTAAITNPDADEIHSAMSAVLADRGPDLTHQKYGTDVKRRVRRVGDDAAVPPECTCSWRLTLLASVLHMRGDELTPQPYVMEDEDDLFVLCWNGEVYSYDFSSSVVVALKEFSPDNIILLGPGNSLGGPVAQVLIDHSWNDLNSKDAFTESQNKDPFLISMGMEEQRDMVL